MKVYQTNEIKNIALLGSAGSGKTTLAESMVYEAGIIKRRGTVEGKNIRLLGVLYCFSCGVEQQEVEHHRLSGF